MEMSRKVIIKILDVGQQYEKKTNLLHVGQFYSVFSVINNLKLDNTVYIYKITTPPPLKKKSSGLVDLYICIQKFNLEFVLYKMKFSVIVPQ